MFTKKQMQEYRSASWRALRQQIFERDGWRCVKCDEVCDETVLQVHHLYYLKDKMPWDYPKEALVTMCKGCHGKEHGHIKPTSGWEYVGYNDLGDMSGECEFCHKELRYEHILYHEKWGYLTTGEQCANHLTETDIASEYEKERRRIADKQYRFIQSHKWKVHPTKNGGYGHFLRQDSFKIKIWEHPRDCEIAVEYYQSDGHRVELPRGKQRFNSVTDAKAHVFRMLEDGTLEKYIRKRYHNRSYDEYDNEQHIR